MCWDGTNKFSFFRHIVPILLCTRIPSRIWFWSAYTWSQSSAPVGDRRECEILASYILRCWCTSVGPVFMPEGGFSRWEAKERDARVLQPSCHKILVPFFVKTSWNHFLWLLKYYYYFQNCACEYVSVDFLGFVKTQKYRGFPYELICYGRALCTPILYYY